MLGLVLLLNKAAGASFRDTHFHPPSSKSGNTRQERQAKVNNKCEKDHFGGMLLQCGQSAAWPHLDHLGTKRSLEPHPILTAPERRERRLGTGVGTSPPGHSVHSKVLEAHARTEVKHFPEVLDRKYWWLCRSHALCHDYSALPLQHRAPQATGKAVSMAMGRESLIYGQWYLTFM